MSVFEVMQLLNNYKISTWAASLCMNVCLRISACHKIMQLRTVHVCTHSCTCTCMYYTCTYTYMYFRLCLFLNYYTCNEIIKFLRVACSSLTDCLTRLLKKHVYTCTCIWVYAACIHSVCVWCVCVCEMCLVTVLN